MSIIVMLAFGCGAAPTAPSATSPPPTASVRPEPASPDPSWEGRRVEGRAPVAVAIRGAVYTVEVARAGEPGYYKGLGERDALPQGRGMLFLESQEVALAFWMKGMRFPLDILWIDRDDRIVHIERNVPPQPGVPDSQLRVYRPAAPARAVLELNAGQAAAYGFQVGDRVLFTYE